MHDSTHDLILILGRWGMYAKTIQTILDKNGHEPYSTTHICKTCRDAGFSIMDYRRGVGQQAMSVIRDGYLEAFGRKQPPPIIPEPLGVPRRSQETPPNRRRRQSRQQARKQAKRPAA